MYKEIGDFLEDFRIPSTVLIVVGVLFMLWIFKILLPPSFYSTIGYQVLEVLFALAPIWLPILFGYMFWKYWIVYIRRKFLKDQEYSLLEIRLPRELERTPQAMESVLNGLHIGPGEVTFINRYWHGKVRPWFSVELVSIEGNIRFFIWMRSDLRSLVESQIYAQYPQVEIYEVSDYTDGVDPTLQQTSLWGCDFILDEPEYYPIKTYVDYGLDKEEKEERKVDPLSNILEFMGSIGEGEQIWIQILFQKYKERREWKKWFKEVSWRDDAEDEINKLMKRESSTKGPAPEMRTSEGFVAHPTLTEMEKHQVEAIQRCVEKPAFHCGIRGIYLADADKFNGINISQLIGSFGHFNSEYLNNFTPSAWLSEFKFPWQDFKGKRQKRTQERLFDAYKKRSYFYPHHLSPYHEERSFVLNTEELATVFHFPGWMVQPPTLERIPSKRAEPPSELPT